MENSPLPERLREERNRIGIDQSDAALLAGVSRNMWGAYERGVSAPGAPVLVRLLGHGFDLNYILGGSRTISESTLSPDEETLIEQYRSMDAEGRASVTRAAMLEALRCAGPLVLHDAPKAAAKETRKR